MAAAAVVRPDAAGADADGRGDGGDRGGVADADGDPVRPPSGPVADLLRHRHARGAAAVRRDARVRLAAGADDGGEDGARRRGGARRRRRARPARAGVGVLRLAGLRPARLPGRPGDGGAGVGGGDRLPGAPEDVDRQGVRPGPVRVDRAALVCDLPVPLADHGPDPAGHRPALERDADRRPADRAHHRAGRAVLHLRRDAGAPRPGAALDPLEAGPLPAAAPPGAERRRGGGAAGAGGVPVRAPRVAGAGARRGQAAGHGGGDGQDAAPERRRPGLQRAAEGRASSCPRWPWEPR